MLRLIATALFILFFAAPAFATPAEVATDNLEARSLEEFCRLAPLAAERGEQLLRSHHGWQEISFGAAGTLCVGDPSGRRVFRLGKKLQSFEPGQPVVVQAKGVTYKIICRNGTFGMIQYDAPKPAAPKKVAKVKRKTLPKLNIDLGNAFATDDL